LVFNFNPRDGCWNLGVFSYVGLGLFENVAALVGLNPKNKVHVTFPWYGGTDDSLICFPKSKALE
jgi:hypothetical protein